MENSASADISRILETVAVSNSKSCWSLKDKFVNELDANWGFYTDTDKQLVSRYVFVLNTGRSYATSTEF